jgi:hypothetical protein
MCLGDLATKKAIVIALQPKGGTMTIKRVNVLPAISVHKVG